jgi:hypothetical protein
MPGAAPVGLPAMTGRRDRPDVVRARLSAQLLSGPPAPDTESVLDRILAVQAQDLRGARLAIRSRSSLAEVSDVDEALTTRRSAVISWLNRGTLHLVSSEDYWWLHGLVTPQLRTQSARRLRQEGLGPDEADRGVGLIADTLRSAGPRTRGELQAVLEAHGVRTAGQALVQLLFAASLRGLILRGPMVNGQSAFADVAGWLGAAPPPLDPDQAWARLAVRYLAGHGPGAPGDLARWAGVTLTQARRGLGAASGQVAERAPGLYDLVNREPPAKLPGPRLLGPFDPVLHGWVDRRPLLGDHRGVVAVNGIFRATALVHGRVVGTWTMGEGIFRINLLEQVSAASRRSLRADAAAVRSYLGLDPAPFECDGPGD